MRRTLSVIHGPVFGGGNNQTMRLAEPLRRRGWDSFALGPDLPEAVPTRARMAAGGLPTDAIELHRLRRTPDPRIQAAFLRSFAREVGRLRGYIRARDIDLVQAFGDTNPHVAIAGHLEGTTVVWQLYDTVTPPPVRRVTMPLVTRIADAIMTTGDGLADAYPGARSLGDRCVAVYPPVDATMFAPDPARRAAARRELGVPDEALLVGTVGNRNPTKGHEYLARAVGELHGRGVDVWCRILGAPSPAHAAYMAEVDREVAALGVGERIAFTDPGTRVANLMPAFDVFALSSVPRSEGVPTVILEAMSCAIPVVATDVGALAEIVEEGETGFVVPPLEPGALAAALGRVLRDGELRGRLGATGRERVLARHELERCADLYADTYARAARHRAGRSTSRS
jgi:glycosyltransferase involved in cell wall biosynthesis